MLQSTKLTGVGHLKSALTSDMEMQSLGFAQLVSGPALVQHSLTMLPFLHLGVVMDILCRGVGEECDLSAFLF